MDLFECAAEKLTDAAKGADDWIVVGRPGGDRRDVDVVRIRSHTLAGRHGTGRRQVIEIAARTGRRISHGTNDLNTPEDDVV